MIPLDSPKQQNSAEPATTPALGERLPLPAAPARKRSRFTHQLWTRADGFTLAGPRRN